MFFSYSYELTMSAQQILKQIPPGIEGLNSSETLFIVSYTFLLLYQNRSTLTVLLFMILKISNCYGVRPQFPNFYINERILKNQISSCMKCLSSVFQVKSILFFVTDFIVYFNKAQIAGLDKFTSSYPIF